MATKSTTTVEGNITTGVLQSMLGYDIIIDNQNVYTINKLYIMA